MFSIMTMAASIMAPMAMAIPPRLMMSAPRPRNRMAMNAIRIPSGNVRIATRALRTWKRKTTQTSGDHQRLLEQLLLQGVDGPVDEVRAVVHRLDDDPFGQPRLDHLQALLDAFDRREGILPESHNDDSAHHVTAPVQVGDAAAGRRRQTNTGDVLDADWDAVVGRADHDRLDVIHGSQITEPPDHVFALGELDDHRAHVLVGGPQHVHDPRDRDSEAPELDRVDRHLVDALVAADGGDLAHPRDAGQLVPEIPVLNRPEVGQRPRAGLVLEHVLVDPAEPGGVRPELGRHALRKPALEPRQVLEHPAPRPVEVGAVVEDHVDERRSEERIAADHLCSGYLEHLRGDRVRDLVLDDAGRLSRVIRLDDDLDVTQVRQRLEGRLSHGERAPGDDEEGPHQHQKSVGDRPLDELGEHRQPPRPLRAKLSVEFPWPAWSIVSAGAGAWPE